MGDGAIDNVEKIDISQFLVAFDGENIDVVADLRHDFLKKCVLKKQLY